MALIDPRTIVTAFLTGLAAVKLPVAFGADVAAFQKVKAYDLEDLLKALEDLLIFKDRAALVLFEQCEHENRVDGRVMKVKRDVRVSVLIADRDWGNRQKALMGEDPAEGATPGALLLGNLCVEAMIGENAGMIIEAETGEIFALSGKKRENAAGRIAWRQEFKVTAGMLSVDLSRRAR
jgi:hypothetical protein